MINIFSRSRLVLKSPQNGFTHTTFLIVLAVAFVGISFLKPSVHHASADSPRITSGVVGNCISDHNNSNLQGTEIDTAKCNNSVDQTWQVKSDSIVHDSEYCLAVQNNGTNVGSLVALNKCSDDSGQVWLIDKSGFYNPNSKMCLISPANGGSGQLQIGYCNLGSPLQTWKLQSLNGKPVNSSFVCNGTKGEKIACNAEKEWSVWQAGLLTHENLLNAYTDNSAYEAWCADFVSYVYDESGYPFSQAVQGWDESNANNIQNMGFTKHSADTGYIPKVGDVAYFDYESGHVEIVISGGKNPTFIYGNSGTIDPTTGNGQMMANTITKDKSEGRLMYYLSPNN